jgi:hypothetical protein
MTRGDDLPKPDEVPLWSDDAALIKWVDRQLPGPDWLIMPWHRWWRGQFVGPPEDREREAIEAARLGNFKLLAELMDPPHEHLRSYRPERLSHEAEMLIAARLRGTFKAKRGKPPRRRPDDFAADEVAAIQELLKRHYPGQRGYRDRAIDIAAHRHGVDPERLRSHRAFKRRRRPK